MGDWLTVVTPWYPTPDDLAGGAFVSAMTDVGAQLCAEVDVVHGDSWPLTGTRFRQRKILKSYEKLNSASPPTADHPAGQPRTVRRVPVLVPPKLSYAAMARKHEYFLRQALPGGRLRGDVVHAHVGLRGGWPAIQLATSAARVVVSEHATYLERLLAERDSRIMYDEVIERSAGLLCVSNLLREQLVSEFPHHENKIAIVPNVVPFEMIKARTDPIKHLRRWLYVGYLIERKGVQWLLEAFAVCRLNDPSLELTIIGDGYLASRLRNRATELGLENSVHLVGSQPKERVLDHMRSHDLLVHPSRYETFGVTLIEAIACGIPVLATACGGPNETLAGLEGKAGLLVPVGDGIAELVAGYWELVDRVSGLDLPTARKDLHARYSTAAVAAALSQHYFPR